MSIRYIYIITGGAISKETSTIVGMKLIVFKFVKYVVVFKEKSSKRPEEKSEIFNPFFLFNLGDGEREIFFKRKLKRELYPSVLFPYQNKQQITM